MEISEQPAATAHTLRAMAEYVTWEAGNRLRGGQPVVPSERVLLAALHDTLARRQPPLAMLGDAYGQLQVSLSALAGKGHRLGGFPWFVQVAADHVVDEIVKDAAAQAQTMYSQADIYTHSRLFADAQRVAMRHKRCPNKAYEMAFRF